MRFEAGEAAIGALVATVQAPGDLNEATTRLQLIDRVMFECLGWDRNECVSEERLDGTITDCSFFAPYRCLILEAKREGRTFDLPVGSDRVGKRPIGFFRKNAPAVFEAIEQCLRY